MHFNISMDRGILMKLCTLFYLSSLTLLPSLLPSQAAPLIVAHRGGTADLPENTTKAIQHALEHQADIIWISVQLSSDNIPVLFRSKNLNATTDGEGTVAELTLEDLNTLDAGYKFESEGEYKFRGLGIKIPTLASVLNKFPTTKFFIDIKDQTKDYDRVAQYISAVITDSNAADRTRVYSTKHRFFKALGPEIKTFAPRSHTRKTLANVLMADNCRVDDRMEAQKPEYHAFELRAPVSVVETLTLGKGQSAATMVWNQKVTHCFKRNSLSKLMLIGVNSQSDYNLAKELQADFVMVDSPQQAELWQK
ncbi:glycerophosphodiester phosphodiesterase family protein [Yersinia nurmii]|uniref:Glycerophosphodiester phosphodiesterase family protein n=2 Tax=Yersinia nurmii TaxID=685706 RepID=A0AAW7JWW1_9GAMM|nr:glycerophosphodiester phosphodiesterase family protein [Yersinia nurmii]MDN0086688.1 glycerophosphodiester phosphodiesterase family protein [Yersinia nurmii]